MFQRLVDYFLPPGIAATGLQLRENRIFIVVLIIAAVSDLMGISMALSVGIPQNALFLFSNAVITLLILLAYRRGMNRFFGAHFFLLQHAFSFGLQAWQQGGLLSPAISAYFLLPALAILIVGKKGAIAWLLITISIITGFYIYEEKYGPPVIIYDLSKKNMLFHQATLAINIYLYIIVRVYEKSKNRAIKIAQDNYEVLKATQAQLVHAEKMASLGELTAGIAHEIQNPLNFVNNFSEVSKELLEEMDEEIEKGNTAAAKAIMTDLLQNLDKVIAHGKRADGIVKGMLQHSRTGSGQKEATDMNALCDEYLKLAYHGYRAKDKTFNAKFESHFDEALPQLQVIPQDIGRVVLNLINNAFYAVNEKAKLNIPGYEPTVSVITKKLIGKAEIQISDNGNGIPAKVYDKIFQPFFTTKPAGQGTGLGLSLSFDIIKAHGGELKAETKESEGTTFTILLPA